MKQNEQQAGGEIESPATEAEPISFEAWVQDKKMVLPNAIHQTDARMGWFGRDAEVAGLRADVKSLKSQLASLTADLYDIVKAALKRKTAQPKMTADNSPSSDVANKGETK